jgi:hypothetical protein
MKKIFVIEINEKDKNIDNDEVINQLEKQFQDFSEKISNNKNLYIRFKRVGSTWKDIINNLKKNSKRNKKNEKRYSKVKKTNHLKLIK